MTIPKPGHAALVVEAQIGGFKMTKVFMDGGSGLNLIFLDTIKTMGITMRMLEETDTCFHGILPTSPAYTIGKVFLNVVFDNCDREYQKIAAKFGLRQEAVDLPSKSSARDDREDERVRRMKKKPADLATEKTGMDDLADFEFFKIILEDGSRNLMLPDKFASVLDGREPRELKLREAGWGRLLWDVEVVFDGEGHMYLGRGWDQFAREYDVQRGHFLVFSYDGDAVLAVKMFDGTMQCHLGARQNQYLNVPAEFQVAHGYAERSKVVLWMRGKSWTVNLKHNNRLVGHPRTSLRYGWHQFCVDNRLDVGDTCFFRALRGGDAGRGEDHVLKVEVRKRDGTFVH
ncbi:hypothetical protein QYE76_069924 [Lolium multiflorum]|uniref:TF-B3 domain-containing protein n=1 Tax=Lolium multiflorum TaxID=4521 RepID=A0AAD8SI89_LOLMU|nr:hypothetical protein QYE76_069924 [Lolium multiflorum]